MLSRRYLAAVVLAGGAAVSSIVVPAVASASTPSAVPSPAPVTVVSTAPSDGKPIGVVQTPAATGCGYVTTANGQRAVEVVPVSKGVTAAQIAAQCKGLLVRAGTLPYPKGAPQTGGGGMAAEVSSWR